MERPLARPHEMRRVRLLDPRVAGLGELQPLFRSLPPAHVRGPGRLEVQVVCVETEDPEQPSEPCEVAVDDALEVRHSTAPPVLEALVRQQAHPDEHIDGHHNVPAIEKASYSARDAW